MTAQPTTEFRAVPGFEDYETDRKGNVRRRTSKGGWHGKPGSWPIGRAACRQPHYNQHVWHLWKDGKETSLTTAQLLILTFGMPRADLVDYAKGERVKTAKLKGTDIPTIRALFRSGMPTNQIGQMYGMAGRTIRDIRSGKIWRHIP